MKLLLFICSGCGEKKTGRLKFIPWNTHKLTKAGVTVGVCIPCFKKWEKSELTGKKFCGLKYN